MKHGAPQAARSALLAAAACLLAAAASAAPEGEEAEAPTTPAARVESVDIPRAAVTDLVKSVLLSATAPPDSAEISRLSDSALDSLIDLELLYQEARRRGLEVSDAAVDAEIERVRGHFSDADEFSAALRRSNLSREQLRADTRKTLLVDALLREVIWKEIDISDEQVRAFYDQHREALSEAPEVHLREIVLDLGGEAALRRAAELRAELLAGADFAELAYNYSTDRNSAARGGDRGFVKREDLPAAVADVAFRIPVGEVGDAIPADDGIHIIQVVERRPQHLPPLADVRASIVAVLVDDERAERKQRFVAELREKAKIEIFPPFKAPLQSQTPAAPEAATPPRDAATPG